MAELSDPIPAATLILMRESGGFAPEVLIVERAKTMAFAAGALVFPGGRIDPADHVAAAAIAPGLTDGAARVAAVRADRHGVVPVETGAGEGERNGGAGGDNAHPLPPEPLAEHAHDTEEARVPGGEHHDRPLRLSYPSERPREIALQDGCARGPYAGAPQVPLAAHDERGLR